MSARLSLLAALVLVVGFAPAPLPRARRGPEPDDLQKMQGMMRPGAVPQPAR